MNQYLSDKFRLLSAFSIILVVYIHMYYIEGDKLMLLDRIESIWGQGVCSNAVPLFYIISGYLFFRSVPDGINSIFAKIKKRGRTLLVPYICANVFTFLFYIILNSLIVILPAIGSVVNFKIFNVIKHDGWWRTLELIFINPPIAFQLWFVRNLMVIVVFSPLIWRILKLIDGLKLGTVCYVVLFIALFIGGLCNGYVGALAWFSAGGYLAISGADMNFKLKRSSLIAVATVYIALIFACMIDSRLFSVVPLVGIPFIWFLYDKVAYRIADNHFVNWIAGYTFFIYLVHEPLLNIFKKIPLLVSRGELMMIICYIVIPPLFCIAAAYGGMWLKRFFPRPYNIYTGSR